MRDLIVSAFIIGFLPTSFRRPFIGLLLFTLLAYMRVQDLTWGFARFQRWSFYVAIITLAGFFLGPGPKRFMLPDLRNYIMILLTICVGVSLVFSGKVEGMADVSRYIEYLKIIGVALFTTGIVKNRDYLLVWIIALSFGFFGVKNGVAMIVSGGSLVIWQGPGGMLADNNDFALALTMGVPLLFHLGLAERRKLMKRAMLATVPLTILTIAATHSRGAFLALTCAIMVLVWRSRNRVAGIAMFVLLGTLAFLAAPQSYKDRIATIGKFDQDSSALGRLAAWNVARNMITARPLTGIGFDKFLQNYRVYDRSTTPGGAAGEGIIHVAHNSYLQIWAECGTPAFLLYLSLMALTYLDLWRVRRLAREHYHSSWILSYTTMFEASFTAFVVGSFFLNRAQFDLFYHFVAVVTVFGTIARKEMEDPSAFTADVRTSGRRGALELVRARGLARAQRDAHRPPASRGFDRPPRPDGFGPALGGA
jgi:probable O-glycosylation ligase (exosortase A-associated)